MQLNNADMTRVEFEETLALWASGEQEMGRFLLNRIHNKLEGTGSPMCPEILGTLGRSELLQDHDFCPNILINYLIFSLSY